MSYTSDCDHSFDVFSAKVDCGGGVSLKCQVAVPSLLNDLSWVKEGIWLTFAATLGGLDCGRRFISGCRSSRPEIHLRSLARGGHTGKGQLGYNRNWLEGCKR